MNKSLTFTEHELETIQIALDHYAAHVEEYGEYERTELGADSPDVIIRTLNAIGMKLKTFNEQTLGPRVPGEPDE